MVVNQLQQCTMHMDINYPWSVSPNIVLFLLITCSIIWVVVTIFSYGAYCSFNYIFIGFKLMTQLFFGKDDLTHSLPNKNT